MSVDRYIEITPGIAGGKARIAGYRITVHQVAIWYERMGMSPDKIAAEHDLNLAEIHAALSYYFEDREEIDRQIAESEAFAEELRQNTVSKVRQKLRCGAAGGVR